MAFDERINPISYVVRLPVLAPKKSRLICIYRDNKFILPEEDFVLETDDEVLLITHSRNLPDLDKQFSMAIGQEE